MVLNEFAPIISVSALMSIATYLLTPNVARKLKSMNIVGIDVHKAKRPKIAEMGGLALLPGILVIFSTIYMLTLSPLVLLVAASTALFAAYGIADDMMKLGKYPKLVISLAVGALLVAFAGPPALIAVPLLLLIVGIGNTFNLFAGFNGLEMGCSASVAFFFSLVSFISGNMMAFYLSMGMFLVLMAFLLHNKYPAKVFPGNIGTFTVGGFFAGIALYTNMLYFLLPLLSLHIADALIKLASSGYFSSSEKARTRVNSRGVLVPRKDYLSLVRLVLKYKPMTERQLVTFFWTLSIAIGIATVTAAGVLL